MNTPKDSTGGCCPPPPCSEYFVTVTLRIPHRLLGHLTKKAIASKDVELVAADWDKVREVWKSPNDKLSHEEGGKEQLVVMVPESEFVSTKYWCAMCGKWGDHQSGTCPQLHSQNTKLSHEEGGKEQL